MDLVLIILSLAGYCLADDIYTSTIELGRLIETENYLLQSFDNTIKELEILEEKFERYKRKFVHHENATEEYTLKYVANPLNSFALIKRLTIDLGELNRIHNETLESIKNNFFQNPSKIYSTPNDLSGIAWVVAELQEAFAIDISEFSNGVFNGVDYGTPLTAEEVFYLGKAMCMDEGHEICIKWLEESLRKWNNDEGLSKEQIMEEISQIYYALNNTNASLEWDNKILNDDPDHIDTLLRKAQNLKDLKVGKNMTAIERRIEEEFNALCRGDRKLPEEITSRLYCYYKHGNHPFLKIAPLKIEMLYDNPKVLLAREMITPTEIKEIKKMAIPKLQRSETIDPDGTIRLDRDRISSSAFFKRNETYISKVLQRNLDLTDLIWSNGTLDFQVTHYPPGGHYKPHYDMYLSTEVPFPYDMRNRVITSLHYLSEVEEGGGTALVDLGLMAKAPVGSAIYWRNLHSSGEADVRTYHGGCPVLYGIKWVTNVWIHEPGQEVATPCGLEYFGETYNVTSLSEYEEKQKQLK